MYQFYYPDGKLIKVPNQEKIFVEFYNQCYYLEVSPSAEKEIECILKKSDPMTSGEIIKILEWKTEEKYIEEKDIIQTRYRKISVAEVAEKIGTIRGPLTIDEAKNILKNLCEIDGIGMVYAITLLYFITNGQYPIYDKFAHIALLAILSENTDSEKEYGGIVPIKDSIYQKKINMGKTKKKFLDIDGIFEQYLKEYVYPINNIFGCNYGEFIEANSNRDIDRALWSYGHLFNENEENKKRLRGLLI